MTASGFFSEEELGPNQSFTPEGFLICEGVPIARIGTQQYADIELPDLEAGRDGLITVERNPDVVFSLDTLASLLGKPVTIGHPEGEVTPENWSVLSKGSTFNPRRGEGDQSDLLIADLLIQDKFAINEVRNNGLKGISVGYDADYQQIAPGRARQTTIVANHVALVRNPRCGVTCSVQDSIPTSPGDPPMAVKNGAESLKDKLRKLFMARDSEAFEKALSEDVEGESVGGMPAIHIHMSTKDAESEEDKKDDEKKEETKDEGPDMAEVLTKFDTRLTSLEKCVKALTKDSEEEKKEETKDDDSEVDGEDDGDDEQTQDSDEEEEKKDDKKSTKDSASFRDEFQDAKARAEILAPGVKLPTFDAKLDAKKTSDAICVLRRRALRTALTNDNASLVKSIVGDADVAKMPCGIAAMAFNAASELVKQKNMASKTSTHDSKAEPAKDLNKIHADFWASHKA